MPENKSSRKQSARRKIVAQQKGENYLAESISVMTSVVKSKASSKNGNKILPRVC